MCIAVVVVLDMTEVGDEFWRKGSWCGLDVATIDHM